MNVTVGIGELKVTNTREDMLVTYSLGSCLGLAIYDPAAEVGGILHAQLPSSKMNEKKAAENPAVFVDTGVPMLFKRAYALGADKKRMIVKVAGCTTIGPNDNIFKIGERNYIMVRKLLWKNNIFIAGEDIGGNISRTMYLDMATGLVSIKSGLQMSKI